MKKFFKTISAVCLACAVLFPQAAVTASAEDIAVSRTVSARDTKASASAKYTFKNGYLYVNGKKATAASLGLKSFKESDEGCRYPILKIGKEYYGFSYDGGFAVSPVSKMPQIVDGEYCDVCNVYDTSTGKRTASLVFGKKENNSRLKNDKNGCITSGKAVDRLTGNIWKFGGKTVKVSKARKIIIMKYSLTKDDMGISSVDITAFNNTSKSIKSITYNVSLFNSSGMKLYTDLIYTEIDLSDKTQVYKDKTVMSDSLTWDQVSYDLDAYSMEINSVTVEYSDGKTENFIPKLFSVL